MELKLPIVHELQAIHGVLIVPLWNWNHFKCEDIQDGKAVLIVPLWNWNFAVGEDSYFNSGFNRTFMELKLKSAQRIQNHVAF